MEGRGEGETRRQGDGGTWGWEDGNISLRFRVFAPPRPSIQGPLAEFLLT
jgi:hypothetical protein